MITQSEQFFVEDMLFLLLILRTCYPHVFERRKTGKDTTSLPTHYVTLGWGKNSCFNLIRKTFLQLFYKAVRESFNQSVSSRKDNLIVQSHTEVDIHFCQRILKKLNDSYLRYKLHGHSSPILSGLNIISPASFSLLLNSTT